MRYRKLAQGVLAGLAVSGVIAGCGSSGSGGSGSSSPPAHAGSSGAAVAQIKANWETFFNAKTPVAKRVSLLQNGAVFQPIIKAQSGSGLASTVSAKVARVTAVTATHAKVVYTILLGGSPVLSNRTGVAVKEGGIWKVGDASFCGLLALQSGGSTKSLPSDCSKT